MQNRLRQMRSPIRVVLLALIVQVFSAASHMAAMAAAGALPGSGSPGLPQFNAGGTQTLVICTTSGIKRITLGPDGEILHETDELPAPGDTAQLCHMACKVHDRADHTLIATSGISLLPHDTRHTTLPALETAGPIAQSYLAPQTRAPPASI